MERRLSCEWCKRYPALAEFYLVELRGIRVFVCGHVSAETARVYQLANEGREAGHLLAGHPGAPRRRKGGGAIVGRTCTDDASEP